MRSFLRIVVLASAACSGDPAQLVGGPLVLSELATITFQEPLRTPGLFHQLCLRLPTGYEVGHDFQALRTPAGASLTVSAHLRSQSGRWYSFDALSVLRRTEGEFACLGSHELVGRQSESFVEAEVISSIAWSTPEVLWLSAEQL